MGNIKDKICEAGYEASILPYRLDLEIRARKYQKIKESKERKKVNQKKTEEINITEKKVKVNDICKKVIKGVGYFTNEIFKEVTGVDIGKEVSPLVKDAKESNVLAKEIKKFKSNKDEFVKEYGIEAYKMELEIMEFDLQMINEDFKYKFSDKKEEVYERLSGYNIKQEKIIIVKDKMEKMSDKQLLELIKNEKISLGIRNLAEQELETRKIK